MTTIIIYVYDNERLSEGGYNKYSEALIDKHHGPDAGECLAWFEAKYGSNDFTASFAPPYFLRGDMLTVTQAAETLRVTPARIRALCQQGRIVGAKKIGNVWILPSQPQIVPSAKGPPLRSR